jgi:hypothetical protein
MKFYPYAFHTPSFIVHNLITRKLSNSSSETRKLSFGVSGRTRIAGYEVPSQVPSCQSVVEKITSRGVYNIQSYYTTEQQQLYMVSAYVLN